MEAAIIDFLSVTNNYRYAKEISGYLPVVEKKLKEMFWEKVKDAFIVKASGDWQAKSEFERNSDNLSFYKHEWRHVSVTIRNLYHSPHFGVYCSKTNFETYEYDRCLRKIKEMYSEFQDNPDWISYKFLNIDWNIQESIIRILPENADSFAKQLTDSIWSYAKDVVSICESLNNARF